LREKYPDQINLELLRAVISDAKKKQFGALCTGQEQGDGGCLMQVSSGREARGKPF